MSTFSISADDLRVAVGRVLPAVATDQARPVLRAIYFEPDAAGVRLTGADNYRLVTMTVPLAADSAPVPAAFMMDRDDVAVLVKALPKARAASGATVELTIDIDDAGDPVTGFWTVGAMTARFRPVGGQYPNYQQVIPIPGDDALRIAFTAEHLASILKALAGDAGVVVLTIPHPANNLGPVLVDTHDGRHLGATAAVMPVRTRSM